jgi:hypothetical protein
MALHEHRPRIDERKVVSAGPGVDRCTIPNRLAYRNSFTGQKGLVCLEAGTGQDHGVGWYSVALVQNDDIIAHQLSPRNSATLTPANDEGARTREVPESFEDPFSFALLVHCDQHVDHGKRQQHEGLAAIADCQIDQAGDDQQLKHWFAEDLRCNARDGSASVSRKFVRAPRRKARGRLLVRQARGPRRFADDHGVAFRWAGPVTAVEHC